ncbi:uncharacterized protein METZ01_LOCUS441614, partial [marine metagenome]
VGGLTDTGSADIHQVLKYGSRLH